MPGSPVLCDVAAAEGQACCIPPWAHGKNPREGLPFSSSPLTPYSTGPRAAWLLWLSQQRLPGVGSILVPLSCSSLSTYYSSHRSCSQSKKRAEEGKPLFLSLPTPILLPTLLCPPRYRNMLPWSI